MQQTQQMRRNQALRALRWAALLLVGYGAVTQQVISRGPLIQLDARIANAHRYNFAPWVDFVFRKIDDLGLRGLTATALLITATYIGYRFKSWRPINLSVLCLLALNGVVGLSKIGMGRTKPRQNIDLINFGGLSYPSGHASNAILTWGVVAYLIYRYAHVDRFKGKLASAGVALLTLSVCMVSLFRNTHWFSDLLGGLFVGGALLVLVVAVDRYFPSNSQLS